MRLELEDAMKLKKGARLVAPMSWQAPERCTKGRTYIMQEDARPLWPGNGSGPRISYKQLRPDDKPCNVELPIEDDRGRLVYPPYVSFIGNNGVQ